MDTNIYIACLRQVVAFAPKVIIVTTMSYAELEVLRQWAYEILAMEGARVMTVEEMNGTIRLLHKGGVTDDRYPGTRSVRREAGQKHRHQSDQTGMGTPGIISSRKAGVQS